MKLYVWHKNKFKKKGGGEELERMNSQQSFLLAILKPKHRNRISKSMSRLFFWGEPMCAKDFAFLFSRLGICLAPGMTPIWP